MMTQNLLILTLSHLFYCGNSPDSSTYQKVSHGNISYEMGDYPKTFVNEKNKTTHEWLRAINKWRCAIASLEELLLKINSPQSSLCQGLILSSPAPILSKETLINQFEIGIFTPEACHPVCGTLFQLPASLNSYFNPVFPAVTQLPLFPTDPLAQEQFSLVFTPYFGLLMVLGQDEKGKPEFYFSFDPELLIKAWEILRSRLLFTRHPQLAQLDQWVSQFMPPVPDYRIVSQFTNYLLKYLPDHLPTTEKEIIESKEEHKYLECNNVEENDYKQNSVKSSDLELLQALTHEIRTPLTTIRTLTKLLLKRKDLNEKVIKHLEVIDQECTEQINRMELIFKAAEFESKPSNNQKVSLTPISLEQVFQQSIPRWKKQAQRHNVLLDVILPKHLPNIVSDPAMLDQILTGLMEKFTRSAPNNGHIKVQITTAGNQLKLQMLSQSPYENNPLKALGNLLMFQPETGSLTLNIDVTKNLFQALGGKLIVRQKPDFGEILTIFLPLTNIK
jgi:signal transduction histidine kinase